MGAPPNSFVGMTDIIVDRSVSSSVESTCSNFVLTELFLGYKNIFYIIDKQIIMKVKYIKNGIQMNLFVLYYG